jgi:hypothetical protein
MEIQTNLGMILMFLTIFTVGTPPAQAGGGGSGMVPIEVELGANCQGSKIDIRDFTPVDSQIFFTGSGKVNDAILAEKIKIFYNQDSFANNIESTVLSEKGDPIWILEANTSAENNFADTDIFTLSVLTVSGKYLPIDSKVKCEGLGRNLF